MGGFFVKMCKMRNFCIIEEYPPTDVDALMI